MVPKKSLRGRGELRENKPKVSPTPEEKIAKAAQKARKKAYHAGRRIAKGCGKTNWWNPFSQPLPTPMCDTYSRLSLKWSVDHGCTEEDLKRVLTSKQKVRAFGFTSKDYYTFIGYVFSF